MARQTASRRQYVQRPGLKGAAEILDVTYSHLRRVIDGKRESRSLLTRYKNLEQTPRSDQEHPAAMNQQNPRFPNAAPDTPSTPPAGMVDPAEANYLNAWTQDVVGKLGFTVVVVQLRSCLETSECGDLGESLGTELHQVGLGHCDSTDWFPKTRHFFYVDAQQLAKALELLKSSLAQRNLLAFAGIAYRDADVWRTFYPGITT